MTEKIITLAVPSGAALALSGLAAGSDPRDVRAAARARMRAIIEAVSRGTTPARIDPPPLHRKSTGGVVYAFHLPIDLGELGLAEEDAARAAIRDAYAAATGLPWPERGRPRLADTVALSPAQERHLAQLIIDGVPRSEAIERAAAYDDGGNDD